MKKYSLARMKEYHFRATRAVMETVGPEDLRDHFEQLFKELRTNLRKDPFSGCFGREQPAEFRVCSEGGWFYCEVSSEDAQICSKLHLPANPYSSALDRMALKIFEFDHIVEQSTIRRNLVTAALKFLASSSETAKQAQLDIIKAEDAKLYSRDNIRLLHRICHDTTHRDGSGAVAKKIPQKQGRQKSRAVSRKNVPVTEKTEKQKHTDKLWETDSDIGEKGRAELKLPKPPRRTFSGGFIGQRRSPRLHWHSSAISVALANAGDVA